MLIFSFVATMVLALLPIPLERSSVDPSAPHRDSDYVTVHGIPEFFFISSPGAKHGPPVMVLCGHFLWDWAWALAVSAAPIVALECIRLLALLAARGVNALRFRQYW